MTDDHAKVKGSGSEAIRPNPLLAEAYNKRGTARSALGDYQGAITDYDKAIEINPQLVQAYYNRGNAKRALGARQDAIIDYDKAIELNSRYTEASILRTVLKPPCQ